MLKRSHKIKSPRKRSRKVKSPLKRSRKVKSPRKRSRKVKSPRKRSRKVKGGIDDDDVVFRDSDDSFYDINKIEKSINTNRKKPKTEYLKRIHNFFQETLKKYDIEDLRKQKEKITLEEAKANDEYNMFGNFKQKTPFGREEYIRDRVNRAFKVKY